MKMPKREFANVRILVLWAALTALAHALGFVDKWDAVSGQIYSDTIALVFKVERGTFTDFLIMRFDLVDEDVNINVDIKVSTALTDANKRKGDAEVIHRMKLTI